MNSLVADASAVLAAIQDEAGGEWWAQHDGAVLISTVNSCEVLTRLNDAGAFFDRGRRRFESMDLVQVAFDAEQSVRAAELRAFTRKAGLSLGDRACLALADTHRVPAVTADRAWAELGLSIEVRLIR